MNTNKINLKINTLWEEFLQEISRISIKTNTTTTTTTSTTTTSNDNNNKKEDKIAQSGPYLFNMSSKNSDKFFK
jgi:hypothetical protein